MGRGGGISRLLHPSGLVGTGINRLSHPWGNATRGGGRSVQHFSARLAGTFFQYIGVPAEDYFSKFFFSIKKNQENDDKIQYIAALLFFLLFFFQRLLEHERVPLSTLFFVLF